MTQKVTIELDEDEAVVLDALLHRWFNPGVPVGVDGLTFEHPSEQRVLEPVLSAQLERQLVALFSPDYRKRLKAAQGRVAGRWF